MSQFDLARINAELGRNAEGLVAWALGLGQSPIVTTNFRPFEAVILHMVTQVNPDVPVVWMDNGYNTEATYRFADEVTKQLGLNLKIYLPLMAPALVAVGTYAMLLAWNEYLYQFLLLSSKSSMTVPVALAQFLSSDQSPWNYMMATAIIYALPPVAIYYAFRRRMTSGLTMGGVKG